MLIYPPSEPLTDFAPRGAKNSGGGEVSEGVRSAAGQTVAGGLGAESPVEIGFDRVGNFKIFDLI